MCSKIKTLIDLLIQLSTYVHYLLAAPIIRLAASVLPESSPPALSNAEEDDNDLDDSGVK